MSAASEDSRVSLSGSIRKPDSNGCHTEVMWSCRAKKGRGLSSRKCEQESGQWDSRTGGRGGTSLTVSSVSMCKTWIQSQHQEVSKEIIIRTVGDRQVSLT